MRRVTDLATRDLVLPFPEIAEPIIRLAPNEYNHEVVTVVTNPYESIFY